MEAQPALEAEQVEHVLHGPVVGFHPQVGVVLMILVLLVQTALFLRQHNELAHHIIVRRDVVFDAVLVYDLPAEVCGVEDLLVAKPEVFAVVVEGKVDALRLIQCLSKDAHAQAGAAVNVLDRSGRKQREPRRGPLHGDALHGALRCGQRGELRDAADSIRDSEPLVPDGAARRVAGVGLQVDSGLSAPHTLRDEGRFGHDAALHLQGQDAGRRVIVQLNAGIRLCDQCAALALDAGDTEHEGPGAGPVGLLHQLVGVVPEVQLPEQSAHLLLIRAQEIGGGLLVRDLEGGAVVQKEVGPVLADPLRHPQGGNLPFLCSVGVFGRPGVDTGHRTLPPLPPGLDVSGIVCIQMIVAGLVQVAQKGGNVHVLVNLLKSRSMVYS